MMQVSLDAKSNTSWSELLFALCDMRGSHSDEVSTRGNCSEDGVTIRPSCSGLSVTPFLFDINVAGHKTRNHTVSR